MAYLTYDEYTGMGLAFIPDDKFTGLLMRAEMTLEQATHHFYQHHDFDNDYPMRQTAYKRALALQLEYMFTFGVTTLEQRKQAQITSQSIGNTSVTLGGGKSAGGEVASLLSDDAKMALTGTGLLFAGVHYAR